MNHTRFTGCLAIAGFLALTACSGNEGGAEDTINTTPASLSEANAEMDKIDRIMAESGSTPELVEQQRLVRERLDVFSGLVDRIEVAPGHSINFFVTQEGEVLVNERMKIGDQSVLDSNSLESITAIYERLAPGRAIPAALENTPASEAGELATGPSMEGRLAGSDSIGAADGTATQQFALTDSASDGAWFRSNVCEFDTGGSVVFRSCVIDKIGGRYAQATSDHARVSVAFTLGEGSIFLRRRAEAGAAVQFEARILEGELQGFVWKGPWEDVRDDGCWPWPIACGTHRESQQRFKRWSVEEASGKKYDMAAIFYNKPLSWNGP